MLKKSFIIVAFICALASASFAQNQNANTAPIKTTRPRTQTPRVKTTVPAPQIQEGESSQEDPTAGATPRARRAETDKAVLEVKDPTPRGVQTAFNNLLDGIRHANVNAVAGAYWNSPQLVLFNSNGTVTRGWEQMRTNRASSYPNIKNVRLDVRDMHIQMLGRDGALVTCLWTQSQNFRGADETASGRMTIVFRRVGGVWKAVHLHTSPDKQDASRVLPSEQTPTPKP
jgi:ketosteroid isomerase-like protein